MAVATINELNKSVDNADRTTLKQQENTEHENEIERRFKEMEADINTNAMTIDEFFERARNRRREKQAILGVEQGNSTYEDEIERRFREMDEGNGLVLTVDEFMTRAKARHT